MTTKKITLPTHFIDLHLHLDGAITLDIAKVLAKLQNQTLPASSDAELSKLLSIPPDCEDLNEYLRRFDLPISLLQTKESISEAFYLVQEKLIAQNVIYAELRFAPQSFMQRGLSQREVVEAALDGLSRSNLSSSIILCCMRGPRREKANLETVQLAKEYLTTQDGITALDLAGAEGLFATSDYRELFALASKLDVPFTLHAGEAAGADSVRCAIEMGARRIGHGVRAFEDDALLSLLKENQIPLELCPTSNRQTKVVSDMKTYPLSDFVKRELAVTLNTDNPAISSTTIANEFAYAQSLGITLAQEEKMLLTAVDAAFTDKATKDKLKQLLCKSNSIESI